MKLFFVHLHKCGGTTLVKQAIHNGLTPYAPHINGNPVRNGEVLPFWRYGPERLKQWLRDAEHDGINFIACEFGCPDLAVIRDEGWLIVSIFRDPVERLISNINYNIKYCHSHVNRQGKLISGGESFLRANFYTRLLGGGLNQVEGDVLDPVVARENLQCIDHMIRLVDMDQAMRELFGWTLSQRYRKVNSVKSMPHPKFYFKALQEKKFPEIYRSLTGFKFEPDEAKLADLQAENAVDYTLYDEMCEMAWDASSGS